MTATDDQGAKRGAGACLQGEQRCRAITCRCFNVGSDISGAISYTATSDLGDFSITRLQEVILASDDVHLWYVPFLRCSGTIHQKFAMISRFQQPPIQDFWRSCDWRILIVRYIPITSTKRSDSSITRHPWT
ncbi:hypothetical protein BO94DRAFT_461652 [Aspergillus sclerotioniger CBS 115572]|uniref:Uncharacterized protein n=1 Tax=Aspergillus sclerotioniger CBS 115572 TaxID=1450535 RepID=A0A317WZU7_9EURO|nr:hypothetical protein BO94DRAFT_461652 [Aspergillus sclerotioniger CBS 115572]PWY91914.1 hypothetical protein BO94DRAFT_461652 [Aspergillus sclerotioniger CBS 115572]